MVEHRVDQHAQTTGMACVDEPDQTVGAAVGFVHAVPQHTVISPTAGSGKGIDRHQLDEVDSEIDQVIQLSMAASNVPAVVNVPMCNS